jgi:hypothetical protein
MKASSNPSKLKITEEKNLVVCISFDRRDALRYVTSLSKFLQNRGISALLSSEITRGERWTELLEHGDALIVVITKNSWGSFELDFFQRTRRVIFPIVFKDVSFNSIPFIVQDLPWLVESERALDRGPTKPVLARLTREIEKITRSPVRAPIERKREYIRQKRPLNEGKLILVGRGELEKHPLYEGSRLTSFGEMSPKPRVLTSPSGRSQVDLRTFA